MTARKRNLKISRYSSFNRVKLTKSGHDFFSNLESLIDGAEHEIHFQTYIFEDDETGEVIANALIRAANRGIRVYLLADAYGSQSISGGMEQRLQKNGVHVKLYGKLYSRGRFHLGRRLHRKVIVIDGRIGIVGGINISNHYNKIKGHLPWLDYAVIIEGETAVRLRLICSHRWMNVRHKRLPARIRQPKLASALKPTEGVRVRVTQNDFLRNKNQTAISYRQAIRQARHSIILVGGYFLPGGSVRRLLRRAVQRGVSIRLIFSEKSDVLISKYAREYLYSWMLRHGIQIYEYVHSNVHGKMMIRDHHFVTIGSYDLNNLSTYSNIELNVDIDNEAFAAEVRKELESVIRNDCRAVTMTSLRSGRNSVTRRIKQWLAFYATKTLFGLSLLLARSDERDF